MIITISSENTSGRRSENQDGPITSRGRVILDNTTVSPRSRTVYTGSTAKFIAWLLANKPELVTDAYAAQVQERVSAAAAARRIIGGGGRGGRGGRGRGRGRTGRGRGRQQQPPAATAAAEMMEAQLKVLLKDRSCSPRVMPIKFDELTAKDFLTWIVSLKKRN